MGKFEATLHCVTDSAISQIRVIKGNLGCLLSYQTAPASGLMININQLQPEYTGHEQLLKKYTDLLMEFAPSRTLSLNCISKNKFHLLPNPLNAIPFTCDKKSQKSLERDVIIEKVVNATLWVSPLMVIPKKDSDVRLCFDMRMPNQEVERERHPTPTVDNLIHKLNGATVVTKLDFRSGYHQLSLADESRHITRFATHKGAHRYSV